jgi:hypothetical protein
MLRYGTSARFAIRLITVVRLGCMRGGPNVADSQQHEHDRQETKERPQLEWWPPERGDGAAKADHDQFETERS